MQPLSNTDHYVTPSEVSLSPLARILGRWRWAFYMDYFRQVLNARKLALAGKYDDQRWAESSLDILKKVERHRGRFDIRGIDILRDAAADAPYVFISNHMSTLETQILPSLIAPFMRVTFVVKESLVNGWAFGPVMRSRDPVTVRRKGAREDLEAVLTGGQRRLKEGISMVVFPQSTRSRELRHDNFNTLGIKLALKAGVKVIPVAVKTDFWGERGLFRGFGPVRPERTIHIEFHAPVEINGRGKREHEEIFSFISSRIETWRSQEEKDDV